MKRLRISLFSGQKDNFEENKDVTSEFIKKPSELKVKCIDCGTIYDYDSEAVFPFNINNSSESEIIFGVCRNCSAEKIQENLKKISEE